jgi:hypothetical protein
MLDIPAPSAATSGFTLAVSPSTLTIPPGSSGASTISVTPAAGFTGTVALAVTVVGAPAGITASLSQTTATGTADVKLTVDVASSALGGNYLVAVTGTSGGVAQTVYVEIGLPYFTLSIAPSALSLDQSAFAAAAITITPQNGFSDKVQFSLSSGLPDGVYAWFHPDTARYSTRLTLVAESTAFTTPNTPLSIVGASSNYTQDISSSLSLSAATGHFGTGVRVNLSSAWNETGIYPTGATYTTGGLDGLGYLFLESARPVARPQWRCLPVWSRRCAGCRLRRWPNHPPASRKIPGPPVAGNRREWRAVRAAPPCHLHRRLDLAVFSELQRLVHSLLQSE